MSYLSDWLGLANPPGSREDERATRIGRPDRYMPFAQRLFGLLRRFRPIAPLPCFTVVSRYDDVQEVLTRPDVFKAPFAEEIARLNDGKAPGTPFILGIDDREAHDAQVGTVMRAFRREDIAGRVAPFAAQRADAIVAEASGKLDAIEHLVTRIPLDICREYYGVPIEEPEKFIDAAFGVSGHLFGIPPVKVEPKVDRQAAIVRSAVDRAIQDETGSPSGEDTVVARLCRPSDGPALEAREIRAILIGMIVGFVPTNTMAGGNILEVLLRRPKMLEAAQAAAATGDDDLLAHCLFEALRFMPINCGPFRRCERDFVIAGGTSRATRIRAGRYVLASTASAMFDRTAVEHPALFVPGRPASNLMHFGFGMHWCVGAFIARAQITQTLKPLLKKRILARAPGSEGKLRRDFPVIGFPRHLTVRYEP